MTVPPAERAITGIITSWSVQSAAHGLVVCGLINCDSRHRFEDATPITTSIVERIVPMGSTYLCYTRNSLYVLA